MLLNDLKVIGLDNENCDPDLWEIDLSGVNKLEHAIEQLIAKERLQARIDEHKKIIGYSNKLSLEYGDNYVKRLYKIMKYTEKSIADLKKQLTQPTNQPTENNLGTVDGGGE